MTVVKSGVAALGMALMIGGAAQAGPATDGLSKCLVQSSTGKDRIVLMQWLFSALSVNPNIQSFAAATKDQRETATRQMANLLSRLVLVDCHAESVVALKEDGEQSLSSSFEVFGKAAAQELMGDPAVGKEMGLISNYLDNAKWAALIEEAKKK